MAGFSDSQGNVFLSPHSISLALAMTYAGAEGQTASQMRTALHFTLPDPALHRAFNALDLSLQKVNTGDGEVQFDFVNAIWRQEGWPFVPVYLDLLAQHYGAAMYLLDFASVPEPSRLTINDWVATQTRDRIRDLLPEGSVTPLTRLVLTNAVYFCGRWLRTFDRELTIEQDFTTGTGDVLRVPMMSLDLGDDPLHRTRHEPLAVSDPGPRSLDTVRAPTVESYRLSVLLVPNAVRRAVVQRVFGSDRVRSHP